VFNVGNTLFKDYEDFRKLLPSRPKDRDHFFGVVYPTLLGQSMAALHDAGLVHTFPTLSNTTLLGGIIDLDSVKGAPLEIGDQNITASDLLNDLTTITKYEHEPHTLRSHYRELERLNVIRTFGVYAYAEYMFVSSYLAHRAPTEDAQEIATRNLISLGASQLPDNKAFEAHASVAPDEASRLQEAIEVTYKKHFEEIFCEENIGTFVHMSIDDLLHEKFSAAPIDAQGLSTIHISAEEADNLVEKVLERMKHVFSFKVQPFSSEEYFDDQVLAAQFPDNKMRNLIYQELYIKYREAQLEKPETKAAADTLRDAIREDIHAQLNEIVSNSAPSDADNYHKYVSNFSGEINDQSVDEIWYRAKSIYGYSNVDLSALLAKAVECNIEVIVEAEDDFRLWLDDETATPREAYTNAPRIELRAAIDAKRSAAAAEIYRDSNENPLYLAWLCEPKMPNDRPSLYVTHEDPSAVLLTLSRMNSRVEVTI